MIPFYRHTLASNFFNVKYAEKPDLSFFLNQFKLDTKRGEGRRSKIIRLVFALHNLDDKSIPNLPVGYNIEIARNLLIESFDEAHTIIDAYLTLGEQYILSVDFNLIKIENALALHMSKEKLKCPEIQFEIQEFFILNVKQERHIYQHGLKMIYDKYAIGLKIKLNTIKDHFEALDNHGKPQTYELLKFKPIIQ